MSDRPDLDKAIEIAQAGGLKITGGKYAPIDPKTGIKPTLGADSQTPQPITPQPDKVDEILDNCLLHRSPIWLETKKAITQLRIQDRIDELRLLETFVVENYAIAPPIFHIIKDRIKALKTSEAKDA